MTTKSESSPARQLECGHYAYVSSDWNSVQQMRFYENLQGSSKEITYQDGPKYTNFRCNWKECHQTVRNAWTGESGSTEWTSQCSYWASDTKPICSSRIAVPRDRLPNGNKDYLVPVRTHLLSEAWAKVWDNLNLNTSDAVLLYSGVIQAVPLVGGALKFTSIMNKAARKLAKSFKQKPFTTVVKTMIQADFIDRFVVKPTIDDAMKFLNAHNYVVNVMNTLHQRAQPLPTAIRQSASTVISSSGEQSTQIALGVSSGHLSPKTPYCTVKYKEQADVTTEVFLLALLSYNTDAVDPIKLWAARCGITRPLDSIWDLIPFSFVIDYFTRAGDFISGLSDKMSDQEGLKGTISRIVGAYAATKCRNGTVYDVSYPTVVMNSPSYVYTPMGSQTTPGHMFHGSYTYDRAPSNPFSFPISEPSGLIHMDLSTTRLRTLLELFIQAKA